MPSMARNCLVVNLDRCIGCYSCELACKMENVVALGHHWNKLYQVEPYGEFPNVKTWWLSKQCQQCTDAPCINVCPTGASYRDEEDGVVLVNEEACIGCKLCMDACPYDVRDYNDELGVVQKCNLCKDLRAEGEKPACVKNCPGGGRPRVHPPAARQRQRPAHVLHPLAQVRRVALRGPRGDGQQGRQVRHD